MVPDIPRQVQCCYIQLCFACTLKMNSLAYITLLFSADLFMWLQQLSSNYTVDIQLLTCSAMYRSNISLLARNSPIYLY